MKKMFLVILAIIFILGGWLGSSYFSFKDRLLLEISYKKWRGAEKTLEEWENNAAYQLLRLIPAVRQRVAFEKGWIAAQYGDFEKASKEFRIAQNPSGSPLGLKALYNSTTLSVLNGRGNLESLAEEYIRVLKEIPEDFRTKVNLEILRMVQKQQKDGMKPQPGESGSNKKKKVKQYQMKDGEGQGSEFPQDGNTRY